MFKKKVMLYSFQFFNWKVKREQAIELIRLCCLPILAYRARNIN